MAIFGRKKDENYEEEDEGLQELEVRDLKPENRRRRKEPVKPWGKKERYTVLVFLLTTILISGLLSASSKNWKLPGIPQIKIPSTPKFNWDFLGGETITIGGRSSGSGSLLAGKAEKIENKFRQVSGNLSGTYAFYVIDLETGVSFGENEKEVLTAASLIKLPVLATLFTAAERGELDLEAKPRGSNLTFRELAREMGKKSNNQAQIAVVKELGEEKVQALIDKVGMNETSYSKNKTTSLDLGIFFQKLWNKEIVSEKSRDEILGYLTDTIYEDWIKKGIPEVRVAHKYGREVHVISDAGIVFSDSPFVLVIMSQGVIDKEADEVIPLIAASVFEGLK